MLPAYPKNTSFSTISQYGISIVIAEPNHALLFLQIISKRRSASCLLAALPHLSSIKHILRVHEKKAHEFHTRGRAEDFCQNIHARHFTIWRDTPPLCFCVQQTSLSLARKNGKKKPVVSRFTQTVGAREMVPWAPHCPLPLVPPWVSRVPFLPPPYSDCLKKAKTPKREFLCFDC